MCPVSVSNAYSLPTGQATPRHGVPCAPKPHHAVTHACAYGARRPYLARRHLSAVLYLNDQGVDFGEGEFRFQVGTTCVGGEERKHMCTRMKVHGGCMPSEGKGWLPQVELPGCVDAACPAHMVVLLPRCGCAFRARCAPRPAAWALQDGSPPLRVAPVAGRLVAYTAGEQAGL